ncbi:MAG: peptidoglycan-binding protein [Acidobacteria bacterium]|nr:peptidoglycan-binding protein [Acidobacteriota bacterium]
MRRILTAATAAALVWLAAANAQTHKSTASRTPARTAAKAPAKKTAPAKKSASAAVRKSAPVSAHKSTATKKGSSTASSRNRRTARKPATTWRNRQTAPSAERYKEIQSALVSRGYLSPDAATGTWGQSSADALKRFQTDQHIDASGKINSLSLIALGLGPNHGNSAAVAPPPPKPQPEPGPDR